MHGILEKMYIGKIGGKSEIHENIEKRDIGKNPESREIYEMRDMRDNGKILGNSERLGHISNHIKANIRSHITIHFQNHTKTHIRCHTTAQVRGHIKFHIHNRIENPHSESYSTPSKFMTFGKDWTMGKCGGTRQVGTHMKSRKAFLVIFMPTFVVI